MAGESYVERIPMAPLRPYVRTVWVHRNGSHPYVQRHLPTGGVELHCTIGELPRIIGPLTRPSLETLAPGTVVVGARFWPGAAASLLGVPVDELADLTVPAEELWGDRARRLGELLARATSTGAATRSLQEQLASWLRREGATDPLVRAAAGRLMPWRRVAIDTLADDLSISASQLRRRMTATVGVAPKVLQRTLRFQGYLALAQAAARAGRTRVADLAVESGYADQAHLARECLRLSGLTPKDLLGGRSDRCACGHDHSASFGPFLAGFRPRAGDARSVQDRSAARP